MKITFLEYRILLGAFCLLATFTNASAEGDDGKPKWLGLKLARGIADPKDVAKPAELSYTKPAGKDAVAVVNAGIYGVLGLPIGVGQELEGGVSLHRNTAIAKRQNTLLAGMGLRGEIAPWLKHKASIRYKNDRIAQERGVIAGYTVYPFIPEQLNTRKKLGNGLVVIPLLSLGIEYERVSAVSDVTRAAALTQGIVPTGATARVAGEAGLTFEVGQITAGVGYAHWQSGNAGAPFVNDKKSQTLKTYSIAWVLDAAKKVNLSLDHVRGSNPVEGLIDEKYTQITLKLNPSFF